MITPSFSLTATERVLPSMALDFTTASLDIRVTFTRTTDATHPATYVNSSGYITSATNNQPRFDYDPLTLACKGLLIEESRTNTALYSEQFDNASWLKMQASVSTGTTTAPDNTSSADTLIENTSNNYHYIQSNTFTANSGTSYTQSWFVKAAGRTTGYISFISGGAFPVGSVSFDLSAGTITPSGFATGTISNFGNGWFRVTLTNTATSTTTANRAQLVIGLASYTGDGTSGLYLWGAQVEAGAFATSYIPTTTTALRRNADFATMTGTNFSDWFNAAEGTIFSEASSQSTFVPAFITDGTDAKAISTRSRAAGVSNTAASVANTTEQLSSNLFTFAAINKVALAYEENNFAWSVNGAVPATDTSGTIPAVNRMNFGGIYAVAFSGILRRVLYYPQRLTNAEVRAITK